MKLPYPTVLIGRLREDAAALGHDLSGRWIRSGLSFGLTCKRCRREYSLVTPRWFAWEREKVYGRATVNRCNAR